MRVNDKLAAEARHYAEHFFAYDRETLAKVLVQCAEEIDLLNKRFHLGKIFPRSVRDANAIIHKKAGKARP